MLNGKYHKLCKTCRQVAHIPYGKKGYICSGMSLKPKRPFDKIRLCINGVDGLDVNDYAIEEALDMSTALVQACSMVIYSDDEYKKFRGFKKEEK